jgi:hypothetical protein
MSSMIGMLKKNLNKKEKSLQAIDPKYYNSSSYNIQTLTTSSTYDKHDYIATTVGPELDVFIDLWRSNCRGLELWLASVVSLVVAV